MEVAKPGRVPVATRVTAPSMIVSVAWEAAVANRAAPAVIPVWAALPVWASERYFRAPGGFSVQRVPLPIVLYSRHLDGFGDLMGERRCRGVGAW
jgi:hypothetical protein